MRVPVRVRLHLRRRMLVLAARRPCRPGAQSPGPARSARCRPSTCRPTAVTPPLPPKLGAQLKAAFGRLFYLAFRQSQGATGRCFATALRASPLLRRREPTLPCGRCSHSDQSSGSQDRRPSCKPGQTWPPCSARQRPSSWASQCCCHALVMPFGEAGILVSRSDKRSVAHTGDAAGETTLAMKRCKPSAASISSGLSACGHCRSESGRISEPRFAANTNEISFSCELQSTLAMTTRHARG